MKKYKEYMDGIKASDTLHQRLVGLETRSKRPVPWKKYGSIAAALALVCGLGAWGLNQGGWDALAARFRNASVIAAGWESAEDGPWAAQPDIAAVDPGDVTEPAEKTLGGYEATFGSGPEAIVTHYILPYIEYGAVKGSSDQKISMDWAIQEGAAERDLTQDEITALLGGADAVSIHLDWNAYELTGRVWERADGSMLLCFLYGYSGPLDHFEFAVMDGQLPPTCIAYPGSVTQEVRGLTVTADKHDGEYGCSRRVSFMKGNFGYRFDLTSTDAEQAELLVSRLVCRIADKGLALWTVDKNLETYTCPYCSQTFLVDDMRVHVHSFVGEVGSLSTEPYDANEAADPSYNAPAASADPEDFICSGYPTPSGSETHTCPICGEALPVGVEHSHELCGLPPAPSGEDGGAPAEPTHETIEVCHSALAD